MSITQGSHKMIKLCHKTMHISKLVYKPFLKSVHKTCVQTLSQVSPQNSHTSPFSSRSTKLAYKPFLKSVHKTHIQALSQASPQNSLTSPFSSQSTKLTYKPFLKSVHKSRIQALFQVSPQNSRTSPFSSQPPKPILTKMCNKTCMYTQIWEDLVPSVLLPLLRAPNAS